MIKKHHAKILDKYINNCYTALLLLASAILYHISNVKRVEGGYFTEPMWITLNTVSYIFFFAFVTGFVISKFVSKK